MKRKDINVDGMKRYEVNPFLKQMGIVFKKEVGSSQMYGEDGMPFTVTKSVWTMRDTYKFCRLYGKGMMNIWPRAMRWDLKTTRLFLWLMQNARKSSDLIEDRCFPRYGGIRLVQKEGSGTGG